MAITGTRFELCDVDASCSNSSKDIAMTAPHNALREFGTNRLDKRLVHKSHAESVLISRVEAVQAAADTKHRQQNSASGGADHFRAFLCISREHLLPFERDCGHVHGICLMEAAQQITSAIAHLFYGVPLDMEFAVTDCSAHFSSMAGVDVPLIAEQAISGHVYRRGRLVRMRLSLVIRQGNLETVRMTATVVVLKKDQLKYLEERAATVISRIRS
jgi:hypothetical protein